MTQTAIHAPLRTTFQNLRKNADKLIKKDPIRAIVELVTNCDDSYRRLEEKRKPSNGYIEIDIVRSRPLSYFEVFDEAQGMDAETMHKVVQLIGKSEDENLEPMVTRGFFREGLKYAIIGLGYGSVASIKDEVLYRCKIDDKGYYNYDPNEEKPATPIFRDRYLRNSAGNGTIVKIVVAREDIKSLPLFENISDQLSRFFSLRDLLSNPKRKVVLVEKDRNHKVKVSLTLQSSNPKGESLVKKVLDVPGYKGAKVYLEILKSFEQLKTKWDVGPDYRENGLLVRAGGAIHDIVLFRFDSEDYKDITSHLFGSITCDYIKGLMEKGDDQIVNDSRDGINLHHPFIQALRSIIEPEIKQIVDKERALQEKKSDAIESEKIKKLIQHSLSILNNIVKAELESAGKGPSTNKTEAKNIPIPPDGFNFFPETDYLVIGKKYTIKLIGNEGLVPSGSTIDIDIDNTFANDPEIAYSPKQLTIDDTDIIDGVWQKSINLVGKKIDAQKTISASYKNLRAEAVLTVTKGGGAPRHRGSSGLINKIEFDPTGDPGQRVRFIEDIGTIKIHTKAPSISRYYGPNGEGQEKLHSRILMAELITEALIRHLARRKAQLGKLIILDEKNPQESMQLEENKLQFKYAHVIHKHFVKESEV